MRERHCRAWIDDEGLVRRILLDDGASIEFYDFGTDVSIEPPPADQVADLKDLTQPRECKLDDGVPISVGKALRAMRSNGFDVTEPECTGTIAVLGGHHGADGEGILSCFLHDQAGSDAPASVQRSPADGFAAQLELHNLECTILTDGPNGEVTIDSLEAAFEELEATVRP